ncbi:MAG: cyclic nucleotide-binding domain-containing protein [Polyangiales bacterium]
MSPTPSLSEIRAILASVAPLAQLDGHAHDVLAEIVTCREASPGEVVVREGDSDRAMYVLASGHARVMRGGVELGALVAGEHFGEIALVAGGVRTASVVADAPSVLLVLDEQCYEALVDREPRVAVQLLREIVTSTSSRLAKMNEAVGVLLRERALPRRVELEVSLDGERRRVRNGITPGELLPSTIGDAPVVAALVDGRARSLDLPLGGNCTLTSLTTAHWEGQRIFRSSLALALLEAARRVGLDVRLGRSLGFAQRVRLLGEEAPVEAAARLQVELDCLVAAEDAVSERLSVLEAEDYFRREGAEGTVRLLETTRRHSVTSSWVRRRIRALEMGPLLPSTCAVTVNRYSHIRRAERRRPTRPLLVFGVRPGIAARFPPERAADRARGRRRRAPVVADRAACARRVQARRSDDGNSAMARDALRAWGRRLQPRVHRR